MNYNKLNNHPEYEKNPFLEDAIKTVHEHSRNKRVFLKGNRSIINRVVDDNGEIVGHSTFVQNILVDEEQFIKLYTKGFSVFYELTIPARKVLGYIIQKCIVPDKDIFYFNFDEAKEVTGYSGDNSVRSGIANLISQGLIARTNRPYKYFLNIMVIFNGSRISFVNNYIKIKNTKNQIL
jgi:hypothetical protein